MIATSKSRTRTAPKTLLTAVTISIDSPREDVFDYLVSCDTYPKILGPKWPIPGISSAVLHSADQPATGIRRSVTLTDGMIIGEEIIEHKRPEVHRYIWKSGLKPPFTLIICNAEAHWQFHEKRQRTQVVWNYSFTLSHPLVAPVAKMLLMRFESWMRSGLARAKCELESLCGNAPATYRTTRSNILDEHYSAESPYQIIQQ